LIGVKKYLTTKHRSELEKIHEQKFKKSN